MRMEPSARGGGADGGARAGWLHRWGHDQSQPKNRPQWVRLNHSAEPPTVDRSSRPDHWTVAALALIAALSLALVLLMTRRTDRPDESSSIRD
jgi:hypothetical protein